MNRPFYLDVIEALNKAGVRYSIVGGGETVLPTASIDDLIAMKRLSARDKDLSDIAALERIKILNGKGKE